MKPARVVAVALVLLGIGVVARPGVADAPAGQYDIPDAGTALGTVYDTRTKLTWEQAGASQSKSWADAKTYCDELTLAGLIWRLPSMKELQTLVDESRYDPSIDEGAFPGTTGAVFWTSTPTEVETDTAWVAGFLGGSSSPHGVSSEALVRCVH